MQISIIDAMFLVLTYLIFGFVGFQLSRRFRRPVITWTWVVLIIVTIASSTFMVGARFLGVGTLGIYVNTTLQAIGIGIILGLATRETRIRLSARGS